MCKYLIKVLIFVVNIFLSVWCADVFHVNSKITYVPDEAAGYFGYSVSLSHLGLHVGAPKARSRTIPDISPGLVFSCPLTEFNQSSVKCEPFTNKDRYNAFMRSYISSDFYKDDMWFGAVVTPISKDGLLICAPRDYVKQNNEAYFLQGVCYVHLKYREHGLYPLRDGDRQYKVIKASRKGYEEYFQLDRYGQGLRRFPYFGTGQVGMSVSVTTNNSILIGAPGVLAWTGAVVEYKIRPGLATLPRKSSPISFPFNTLELGADNLFGYSVDSGVFDATGLVLFVSGAPRGNNGYGQVLIYEPPLEELAPLKVKAKLVGPQLGSYFGASLCTVDINRDGLNDILVGAPNYAKKDELLRYDQGAVFIYMSRKEYPHFVPVKSGYVMGSAESGARFGTAIANLGDIDGDSFNDVAIGAPHENDGAGAVYIYKGNENGLNKQPFQRIQAKGSSGFGFAISKGYDVDENRYNDVAIGAYNSGTTYVYRSIPTLQVLTSVKLPNSKHLSQNSTHFTVLFCVTVPERRFTNAEIEMKAVVSVDPEHNRAKTLGAKEYIITVKEKLDTCNEHTIEANNQSDFSTPILLQFHLYPVKNIDGLERFPTNMARISEDSNLQSSIEMQVLNECGDDLYCKPWLEMTLEPSASPYVPGLHTGLGVRITVVNKEEPAFSVKLAVAVPSPLRRLPESCTLNQRAVSKQQRELSQQQLTMSCALPAPLRRGELAVWDFDLEYAWDGADKQLNVTASLRDPLYQRNITDGVKEVIIPITPESDVVFSGKVEPNDTIAITRETFDKNGEVFFTHYFELYNRGPSDLYGVNLIVHLPEEVILTKTYKYIKVTNNTINFNDTVIKANTTVAYVLPLRFNISEFGNKLDEALSLNLTSKAYLSASNFMVIKLQSASTVLVLEPKPPIWLLIVGLVAGLLLLALIILGLYKFGFFSRKKKDELEQLLENAPSPTNKETTSSSEDTDEQSKHQDESDSDINPSETGPPASNYVSAGHLTPLVIFYR